MMEPEKTDDGLQVRGEFVVNAPMVSIENNTHDADGNPIVSDPPPSDPEE